MGKILSGPVTCYNSWHNSLDGWVWCSGPTGVVTQTMQSVTGANKILLDTGEGYSVWEGLWLPLSECFHLMCLACPLA